MGWLWGSSKDGDPNESNDPMRDLDPSLRDFLEKESPVKYKTSASAPSPLAATTRTAPTTSSQSDARSNSDSSASTISSNTPSSTPVPPESLYPDGRYAHLWATYRPLSVIEAACKSDQEKLLDILEGYKQRKAEIGRAALENCAIEQWTVNDCFRNGGWSSRMTMCRAENRELERCFLMQSRFLKALGYLSSYDRPPEANEKIQMYADTLYHRMLDQEKAIEEAKAAGLPEPSFQPVSSSLTPESLVSEAGNLTSQDPQSLEMANSHKAALAQQERLSPAGQAQLKERLKGLAGEERDAEEKAIAMEMAAGIVVAKQIGEMYEEQGRAKRRRKEQGKETFTDKLNGFFGW